MSLKFLYTLVFIFFILISSLASSLVIYNLYKKYKKDIFIHELQGASMVVNEYYHHHLIEPKTENHKTNNVENLIFNQKKIQILNSKGEIVFSYPSQKLPIVNFNTINKKKDNVFNKDFFYQLVSFDKESKLYTIIEAVDDESLKSLSQLKFVLTLVPFCFCIACFLGGSFVVNLALNPLKKLNAEISTINETSLTKKLKISRNISEANNIAISFNNLLHRLDNAFKSQKNFVQHASHELRTPLTTMFATTQAALEGSHSVDEYKEILRSLKQDQNNLIELSNALLLLSQLEKLQYKPEWKVIRIDDLLYESMAYTKKIFNGMVIDFAFNTIPETEDFLQFKASEPLLRSAFTNLIKNAFLYSNNQKTNIILVADKDSLEVHFENTGRHLSEKEVLNLKEPFLQGNNVGLVKGFGLGLSIVQRIATIHNGDFIYTPLNENKNRFTIKLR